LALQYHPPNADMWKRIVKNNQVKSSVKEIKKFLKTNTLSAKEIPKLELKIHLYLT